MYKQVLTNEIVDTINKYTIIKMKEKNLDYMGTLYGHTEVWYNVCLDNEDGDIVASFKTVNEARKWAREN